MFADIDRLVTVLNTSGLQNKDQPLYQVILNLIRFAQKLSVALDNGTIGGGSGAIGPIGPQGPMGPLGIDGIDGIDGVDGQQSTIGPSGPSGPTGPAGPAGITVFGIDGIDGIDGEPGTPGPQGFTGAIGLQGIPGISGIDGIDGENSLVPGPTGSTGNIGPIGPQGFDGEDGIDGINGPQGPQGIQGIQGPAGSGGGMSMPLSALEPADDFIESPPNFTPPFKLPSRSARMIIFTVNLGTTPNWRGKSTLVSSGFTNPFQQFHMIQAPGPYIGKGIRADEAEMDVVHFNVDSYVIVGNLCTINFTWYTEQKYIPESNITKNELFAILASTILLTRVRTIGPVQRAGFVKGNFNVCLFVTEP